MKGKVLFTIILVVLLGVGVFTYIAHSMKAQPKNMQQTVVIAADHITVLSAANRQEIKKWLLKHQQDTNAVLLTHMVKDGMQNWVMYVKDPKTNKFVAKKVSNTSPLYALLTKDNIANLGDSSKLIDISDTKIESQLAKSTSDYINELDDNAIKVPANSNETSQADNAKVVVPATTAEANIMTAAKVKKSSTHRYVANPVKMYAAKKTAMAKPITVPSIINKKVQIGGEYSDEFGSILDTKFAYQFNHMFALAAEGDIGAKEYRIGGTVGFMPTAQQLIKVTFEHLAQKIKFDFITGSEREWIGQNAGGASYDYFFKTNRHYLTLNSLGVSGYYSKADSKNFDPNTFFVTGRGYEAEYIDYRHIAGGQAEGVQATVSFTPWIMSSIKVGAGYDAVKYDMKYSADKDSAGVGGTVDFEQLIGRQIRVDLSADLLKAYDDYTGRVSYLFHTRPGTQLELAFKGSHINDRIASTRDNRVGLDISYAWGGTGSTFVGYTLPQEQLNATHNLLAEVMDPVVHMSKVLALADEKLVTKNFTLTPTSRAIADTWANVGSVFSFNAAQIGDFYTSAPNAVLKYSLHVAAARTPLHSSKEIGLNIDSNTGVITSDGAISGDAVDTVVTVTADEYLNGKKTGSTSETFTVYVPVTGESLGTKKICSIGIFAVDTARHFDAHSNSAKLKYALHGGFFTWKFDSNTGELSGNNGNFNPPGSNIKYSVTAIKYISGVGSKAVTESGILHVVLC